MTPPDGSTKHLLLLAGSGEARAVAKALRALPSIQVATSLARPDADPGFAADRTGGFGGRAGFRRYLVDHRIDAVLDATHPFAVRIGNRSAEVCAELGISYARLLRPPWTPQTHDIWTEVANEEAVGPLLRPGQRAFATTGRATLAALVRGAPAHFFVRRRGIFGAAEDFENVTYVEGQGPFSVADETAVLEQFGIDVLIAKNSGGAASRTKLDAARALGLPVILIARPEQPPGPILTSVEAALEWVSGL